MRPSHDQIEVSLFGPGYGESIVMHLGGNNWVIIDSCERGGRPVALTYLESIGVTPSEDVKLVIITHWHDDHIRGMGELVKECANAKVCISSALTDKEFLSTVLPYNENRMLAGTSGVAELAKVLDNLKNNSGQTVPLRAIADRTVLSLDPKNTGHGLPCDVYTLTPTDKQFELFLNMIAHLMPSVGETKYRAPSGSPNHASVVTWVVVGDLAILLGADLEETQDSETGWTPVLSSPVLKGSKASIFKVPHHGSITAHNDDVWADMLSPNPSALLTPFNRGRKKLPSADDVLRINSCTSKAYCTASSKTKKNAIHRPAVVEKTIKEVASMRVIDNSVGHIRMRNGGANNLHSWHTELLSGAYKL